MTEREHVRISKFLSLVLRHRPEAIGVELDEAGWVDIALLLEGCAAHGQAISRATLDEIVASSPKQRFACSSDGHGIRANQGHSVNVELGYQPWGRVACHAWLATVDRMLPGRRRPA